jgi:hypothetical protein
MAHLVGTDDVLCVSISAQEIPTCCAHRAQIVAAPCALHGL